MEIRENIKTAWKQAVFFYIVKEIVSSGDSVPLSDFYRSFLKDLAGDDQTLDLTCAFVDTRDSHIAVIPFHRIFLAVAVTAVNLHGVVSRAAGSLGL